MRATPAKLIREIMLGSPKQHHIKILLESQLDKQSLIAGLTPLLPDEFQGKTDQIKNALADQPAEKASRFFCEAGLFNYQCGEKGSAALNFLLALEIDPNSFEVLYNIGVVFDDLGDYVRAEVAYVLALQLNRKFLVAWLDIGVLYLSRERQHEAIFVFEQAIQVDPNCAEAWKNLGAAFIGTMNFEKASKAYRRAAELKLDDVRIWENLALSLAFDFKFDDALEAARRTLDLDPENAQTKLFFVELQNLAMRESFFRNVLASAWKVYLERKHGIKT